MGGWLARQYVQGAAAAPDGALASRRNLRARRLSFGLQNKVMVTIAVALQDEGATHVSYIPIHPTAAAASVLQNNPVVVVRQGRCGGEGEAFGGGAGCRGALRARLWGSCNNGALWGQRMLARGACASGGGAPPRRTRRRSPLWDQEDVFQREGCTALTVVSMPFYWPPSAGAAWDGHPLTVPAQPLYHPTFGAMSVAAEEQVDGR